RRSRPLGGSRGSGGSAGTSAGLPGASRVRAAASKSAFVRASAITAWRVSLTASPTACFTARSTAPSTADATAPFRASLTPSRRLAKRSNWEARVLRTEPFVVVVIMTIYSLKRVGCGRRLRRPDAGTQPQGCWSTCTRSRAEGDRRADGTQPTESCLRLTGRAQARDDFVTARGQGAPPSPAATAPRRSGSHGGDGLHTGSAYHGEGAGGWLDRTSDSQT